MNLQPTWSLKKRMIAWRGTSAFLSGFRFHNSRIIFKNCPVKPMGSRSITPFNRHPGGKVKMIFTYWNSDIRIVRSILLALCFPGGSPA
jgi:hypothetical protein